MMPGTLANSCICPAMVKVVHDCDPGSADLSTATSVSLEQQQALRCSKLLPCRTLGAPAGKRHAYARALHYRELEFRSDPEAAVEALISINRKCSIFKMSLHAGRWARWRRSAMHMPRHCTTASWSSAATLRQPKSY